VRLVRTLSWGDKKSSPQPVGVSHDPSRRWRKKAPFARPSEETAHHRAGDLSGPPASPGPIQQQQSWLDRQVERVEAEPSSPSRRPRLGELSAERVAEWAPPRTTLIASTGVCAALGRARAARRVRASTSAARFPPPGSGVPPALIRLRGERALEQAPAGAPTPPPSAAGRAAPVAPVAPAAPAAPAHVGVEPVYLGGIRSLFRKRSQQAALATASVPPPEVAVAGTRAHMLVATRASAQQQLVRSQKSSQSAGQHVPRTLRAASFSGEASLSPLRAGSRSAPGSGPARLRSFSLPPQPPFELSPLAFPPPPSCISPVDSGRSISFGGAEASGGRRIRFPRARRTGGASARAERSEQSSTPRNVQDESSAGSLSSGDEDFSGPRLAHSVAPPQTAFERIRPPQQGPAYIAGVRKAVARFRKRSLSPPPPPPRGSSYHFPQPGTGLPASTAATPALLSATSSRQLAGAEARQVPPGACPGRELAPGAAPLLSCTSQRQLLAAPSSRQQPLPAPCAPPHLRPGPGTAASGAKPPCSTIGASTPDAKSSVAPPGSRQDPTAPTPDDAVGGESSDRAARVAARQARRRGTPAAVLASQQGSLRNLRI
jgi:hypothetical protein